MKIFWQVFMGILIALASIGLLLGGISLSLAEGNTIATYTSTSTATATPTPPLTPTSSPTWQASTPSAYTTSSAYTTPSLDLPTPSSTRTPTLTLTPPPSPSNCPPPAGWLVYFVQPGETLDSIAARYRISTAELQGANCLLTTDLIPGVVIYVPPLRTQTPLPCGVPFNWVVYYVQPGDTLYRLSLAYGVTVADLQRANCLGSSTLLHTNQLLYVPPGLPRSVLPTATGMILPTSTQLYLPTNSPPPASTFTSIPTDTPIPVPSDTPVELPSDTPVPDTP